MPYGGLIGNRSILGEPWAENFHVETPQLGNPIITKIANNWKTVQDREKVITGHLWKVGVGLYKSTAGFVVMANGSCKWPQLSKLIKCTFNPRTIQDRPKKVICYRSVGRFVFRHTPITLQTTIQGLRMVAQCALI